jgi:transposase
MEDQYFAGIDAHLASLQVAVLSRHGVPVLETRVSTKDPARLLETLAPFRPLDVVVETCPVWPWIYDLLVPEGIHFHLAHAKALRLIAQSARKTDEHDAMVLARMLATGLIPAVYPKPAKQRDILALVRHRACLVRHRTSFANRIHAKLHAVRLSLPRERLLRVGTRARLRDVAGPRLSGEQRRLIGTHLVLIRTLTQMVRGLDRRIRVRALESASAQLLQSIPGIGPYRGLLLATELAPIQRFPDPAHLASYAGLAPVNRNSGSVVRTGPIPQGANRYVRGALVSAIPSHVRFAPESALSLSYRRLSDRVGWQVARVATARKLSHIVYRMLVTGTRWHGTSSG